MKILNRIIVIGLVTLPVCSAFAAPVGFSVNSDEPLGDKLYSIDLATGAETVQGTVMAPGETRMDIEGLALDRFGVLWAVDDQSLKLFPVSKTSGVVNSSEEAVITGLGALSGNDFGMTFTCAGDLYISTVSDQSLYTLALDGTASLVGSTGLNISALASYGNPARLYGLGNGLTSDGGATDNRSLYEIDRVTGDAQLIGELGAAAGPYFEAGLSFDENGGLWAITDRRTATQDLGSEILNIDPSTGQATLVATTSVTGFESLAVAPPSRCSSAPPVTPPVVGGEEYARIPTLDSFGRLATILCLLIFGFAALRQRP